MSLLQIVEEDQSPRRQRSLGPRVPPNLFGIALGIAGLAQAWRAAVPLLGTTQAIPDALSILDAAVWLALVGAYLAQGPRIILADLRDPVLSPFVSAPALTAMILAAALAKEVFTAGRVLVIVFLAITVGIGGWLTGQWMTGGIEPDSLHPGYLLPTAAGGLVGPSRCSPPSSRGSPSVPWSSPSAGSSFPVKEHPRWHAASGPPRRPR